MEDARQYCLASDKSSTVAVMTSKHSRVHLYQSVFVLNIMYLACGTTFVWSSPVLEKLDLSDAEGSSVASMLSLGSLLGPFISGAFLDRLGRKGTVTLSMMVLSVSWFILMLTTDYWFLCIGRFISGILAGITGSAVPTYIAEISENSVRGFLNTLSNISVCIGSLIVYCVGPQVSYATLHYILFGITSIFFIFLPVLPDSPHSLVMKNEFSKAKHVLAWLRKGKSEASVEKELEDIKRAVNQNQCEKGTLKDLVSTKASRKALIIGCVLVTVQQVSGISIVFFFSTQIFSMAGTSINSNTCSIVVGVMMLISSFFVPPAVKQFGYKIPLIVSGIGMAVGMGGLGVFFLLKNNDFEIEHLLWMPLLSLVIYILFFNSGFSIIPWALSGELFTSNIKPKATALITITCGIFAFLSTILFPHLKQLIGIDFVFMTCSFFCCLGVIFVALVVQDTNGLSFSEIQELLNGKQRKEIELKRELTQHECIKL